MRPLQSSLEHRVVSFDAARDRLDAYQFTVGGNWEYDNGYFDRPLDEAQKVWLRIPFEATAGAVDAESGETGATVRLGQPFVLRHVYNVGLDPEAAPQTVRAFVDQFQSPLERDADVGDNWLAKASDLLRQVEAGWPR